MPVTREDLNRGDWESVARRAAQLLAQARDGCRSFGWAERTSELIAAVEERGRRVRSSHGRAATELEFPVDRVPSKDELLKRHGGPFGGRVVHRGVRDGVALVTVIRNTR